ncbi:MAG: ABC transporter substrate-binding protein, partial [Chloroflexota bacterium]|nr:ABC transporter substrate-binding protein [Chloroflexota bacterium]
MRKLRLFLILATAILLLAGACAPAAPAPTPTAVPAAAPTAAPATAKPAAAAPTTAPATPKPAPMTVKMSGVAGSLADSGIFIAQAKGYFAEQGLNIDYVPVASAADVIASLATGDLDVSGGGWNLGLANAILRGVPVKVVADKQSKQPGFTNHRLYIRKDLYDSGQIRGVADLKGKKLAVASVAAMGVLLAPNLRDANLTFKDVDLVPMSFPEMVTALANKAVDATAMAEPSGTLAVEQGLAVRAKRLMDDPDPAPSAGIIYFSPQFAQKVDAGNRFMIAYVKGL